MPTSRKRAVRARAAAIVFCAASLCLGGLALERVADAGEPARAQAQPGELAAPQGEGSAPRRLPPSPRRPPRASEPGRFSAPGNVDALRGDLSVMLTSRIRSGSWGVMIVSLTRGDTLYARSPGELLLPASTMKLFTSALALHRLGPDHQFTTDVLRDGMVTTDGTLEGNLILRGGGDPAFSGRFVEGGPAAPVAALARQVAEAGIHRIAGDIVGDASAFETRLIPEGWRSRNLGYGYAAPVSALSISENVMSVVAEPGAAGTPAQVRVEPASSEIEIRSTVRTVAGRRARISARRLGSGVIDVRGWIGTRSGPRRYLLVIDDPARFTAGAFRDALERHGITVDGEVRLATTPPSAAVVATLASPPLHRMVSVMNRESINHYAELVYRNAARGRDQLAPGSAEHAFTQLRQFMIDEVGADSNAIIATDGSGLSTLDRVTPRALVQLLDYAHRAPWSSVFHASLPVAGESELLRHRMQFTPAHGNLHAKTGTTSESISLAGYATARNGEIIAFAFIYNGRDRRNARQTIDQIGATLASFIRE